MGNDFFDNRFAPVILFGTALAMGVSVIALRLVGFTGLELFVGVGLACLGLVGLAGVEREDKPKRKGKK